MADTFSPQAVTQAVLLSVRNGLFSKAEQGLGVLRRYFATADVGGTGYLDREELEEALSFAGVFLRKQELSALFRVYDREATGSLGYGDLIHDVGVELNERRMRMLRKVFTRMVVEVNRDPYGLEPDADPDTASLPVDKALSFFSIEKHPEVAAGRVPEAKLLAHVANGLVEACEAQGRSAEELTLAAFVSYYEDLGAAVPSDDFFVLCLANAWGVTEADRDADKEQLIQHYVSILREKSRQKARPRETEPQRLRRAFVMFDADKCGSVDEVAFRKVLAQMGVPLSLADTHMMYMRFPHSDLGFDYDQFVEIVYKGVLI